MIVPLFSRITEAPAAEIMEKEHNNLLKESFRIFYEKHSQAFLNFIRKACGGDEATARDIFQESFFRLFRSSPHGLNEYQLKSYLYKTAYRLVIDEKRKKRQEPLNDQLFMDASENDDRERRMDVAGALDRLDKKSRSLLILAHVEGYSYREISGITGIRETSLKVTMFRARRKFENILRSSGFSMGEGNE